MQYERSTRIQPLPEIKVTRTDLGMLDAMLAHRSSVRSWKAVEVLVNELLRAKIVDRQELPANVVTMDSQVEFRHAESELSTVVTLVFPGDSGLHDDALSVLTPVGALLLGLSEGQSMRYFDSDDNLTSISVLRVLQQPKSSQRA